MRATCASKGVWGLRHSGMERNTWTERARRHHMPLGSTGTD